MSSTNQNQNKEKTNELLEGDSLTKGENDSLHVTGTIRDGYNDSNDHDSTLSPNLYRAFSPFSCMNSRSRRLFIPLLLIGFIIIQSSDYMAILGPKSESIQKDSKNTPTIPPSPKDSVLQPSDEESLLQTASAGPTTSRTSSQEVTPSTAAVKVYPAYLVDLKSSRVGSTFFKDAIKNEYPGYIYTHWEGNIDQARSFFEKCPLLCSSSIDTNGGKCACTVHLNDCMRTTKSFDGINRLIQDFNASVVIQMRANAIEKGISMSKRWGVLLKNDKYPNMRMSEEKIAKDVKMYAEGTLAIAKSYVHADAKKLFSFPSPTQHNALWIWYEDLMRSPNACKKKFDIVFKEIGMSHLPPPKTCGTVGFKNDGPYNDTMVEIISEEYTFIPMLDHYKYNMEIDTDEVYSSYRKETENVTGPILGVFR